MNKKLFNLNKSKAFTLIELLIVISIIGIMAGLLLPNFMNARSRARDSAKKADLKNLKTAMQLYYTDYQFYPDSAGAGTDIAGCGVDGDTACGARNGNPFQAGSTVYMKKFPASFFYYVDGSNDDYILRVQLENASDEEIEKSHSRCQTSCTATSSTCCDASSTLDFCLCPD